MKSIPAGLPISEQARLLSYCKAKYQPGFMFKSELPTLARRIGKDQRTVKRLFAELTNDGLIGQDSKAYYFRSWKFITAKEGFNTQAFRASLSEISSKQEFECLLFGAKITGIEKAFRRAKRSSAGKGDARISEQIPSGFLANACKISQGKVSELKRIASAQGVITVERSFTDHGAGTTQTAQILKREMPGIFLKEGRLKRRKADQIISNVETFRIKNRKTYKDDPRSCEKIVCSGSYSPSKSIAAPFFKNKGVLVGLSSPLPTSCPRLIETQRNN
ncbi:MAG: hypothetical protein KF860_17335 [Cyclobacteriaceae bacterium]|nr:hypothetical protein [Cyclobacteriaceae bacterium]